MRQFWIRVHLHPMTGVLIKRQEEIKRQKRQSEGGRLGEDRHRPSAAVISQKMPPPEARKREGRILPVATEGARPCGHLGFGFLASRTGRE